MKGVISMKIICFGVLVLGILFVRKLFWGRISRVNQYLIWGFAALFLVLSPFLNITGKFSFEKAVYYILNETDYNKIVPIALNHKTTDINTAGINNSSQNAAFDMNGIHKSSYIQSANHSINDKDNKLADSKTNTSVLKSGTALVLRIKEYWPYIFYGITTLMLLIFTFFNFRLFRFCYKNRTFYCKAGDTKLSIYLLNGISSPFLLGHDIYVDEDMIKNKKILNHIIIHEYCHFKHCDNFWILVINLCFIFNWYNPFTWLVLDYVKRDCELACDESVLKLLGTSAHKDYGYTLISLLKRISHQRKYTGIAITMSGNMRKLKERITMIQTPKNNNVLLTWIALIFITLLTGCTITQKETPAVSGPNKTPVDSHELSSSNVVIETITDSKEESILSSDTEKTLDKYYNVSAKYFNGYTYVASKDTLYKIKDNSTEWEIVCRGSSTLGTIAEGYLYFYLYPENMKDAAIMSLNLSDGELSTALSLGKAIYPYREMYSEKGNLYVNKGDGAVAVYKIEEKGTLRENGSLPISIPDSLQQNNIEIQPVSMLISNSEGYTDKFYMTKEKQENFFNRLYVYKDDSLIAQTENITDIMITEKGVIGRDINNYNDIYLYDIYTNDKQLLYSASENEERYFGYNTYDNEGIYGLLKETDTAYTVSRINWNGTLQKLFSINGIEFGTDAQMSVINDFIYYYNAVNGKMERRHLTDIQTAESIE